MKATFQNTVDILVKAYLNDTLKHGSCAACAVGNIVADCNGFNIVKNSHHLIWCKEGEFQPTYWDDVFLCDYMGKDIQSIYPENYIDEAKEQIDSTGYSYLQLARIEKAFEMESSDMTGEDKETAMFNGLMSVVDVLAEIHGIDLTEKESAKALFVKA